MKDGAGAHAEIVERTAAPQTTRDRLAAADRFAPDVLKLDTPGKRAAGNRRRTERVPTALVATLAAAGVEIARYRHPAGLPMQARFLLLTGPRGRSRKRNPELLLRTADAAEVDSLQERFDAMWGEPFAIVEKNR